MSSLRYLPDNSWMYTKLVKDGGEKDQILHFLLDHPRRSVNCSPTLVENPTESYMHANRCFLYLFPSHVTWYLVATLLAFTYARNSQSRVNIYTDFVYFNSSLEWISFIVLDLGLEVLDSLPPGARAVAGLFQSFAVRASGFSIVSIASLAPSFQCVS